MAVKWQDGAEALAVAASNGRTYAGGSVATTTPGRISPGTRCYAFALNDYLTTPPFASTNTWIVNFGLKISNSPSGFQWRFLRAGTEQLRLEVVHNGSTFELRLKRGSTTVATTAQTFALNVWHHFEAKVVVRTGTNGSYEIRHNEIDVLSASGVNLADTGSDGCNQHSFGYEACNLDDLIVLDGTGGVHDDFIGDHVIVALKPNGDGASTQWTPTPSGTHYTTVDDDPTSPNDADYIASNTTNQKDLFAYENLPVAGLGDILAVSVITAASMESVGSRTLRPVFRAADTTEGEGDDFTVDGTVVQGHMVILPENPATTDPWVGSDIDAGQFGVEVSG